jgi:hypothetical protein
MTARGGSAHCPRKTGGYVDGQEPNRAWHTMAREPDSCTKYFTPHPNDSYNG